MQAIVNAAYPNRIQLMLATLTGPFTSSVLGAFDPRRDLEIYIDGPAARSVSSHFDASNNRYLIFTAMSFDPATLVQVVHHSPAPAFTASGVAVPSFACIASISTAVDVVIPSVGLSVPPGLIQNQPVVFTWSAVGVAQIRITTSNGFNSGLITALSAAGVVYTAGFASTGSYVATIAAFDSAGVPIAVGGTSLTLTILLVISTS